MRFKKNGLYYIKFHDHTLNSGEDEFICRVCGWVKSSGKNLLTIIYWNVDSKLGDKETEESNQETMKIVKKTIIDCKLIELGE